MPEHELVVPVVHANGTSKAELLKLREDVYATVHDAADALKMMAPNGRDYYPIIGLLSKAEAQHRRRQQALSDLLAELEAECAAIDEQEGRQR